MNEHDDDGLPPLPEFAEPADFPDLQPPPHPHGRAVVVSETPRPGVERMFDLIERAAFDAGFDAPKFRSLVETYREEQDRALARYQAQERRKHLDKMFDVQCELGPVITDAVNAYTKSHYATYPAVHAVVHPVLIKHGVVYRFFPSPAEREGWVRQTLQLAVRGIDYIEEQSWEMPSDLVGPKGTSSKTGPQAIASTATYMKRHLLVNVLNLVALQDDDDGNLGREPPRRDPPPPRPRMGNGSEREHYTAPPGSNGAQPPKPTQRQWLDGLDAMLAKPTTSTDLLRALADPSIQTARDKLTGAAKDRIEAIVAREQERARTLAAAETQAAGEYAVHGEPWSEE